MAITKTAFIITALCGVLALSACAGPFGYAAFDREPNAADAPPPSVQKNATEIDTSSSRFAGKDGDVSLWIAKGDSESICLIFATNDDDWYAGCGKTFVTASRSEGIEYTVHPDGTPIPEGVRRISDNIYVSAE